MAGTTTIQALPYPTASDAPAGHTQMLSLAQALETKLVMIFSSSTDRGTKVPSPTEGMIAWLQDVNRFDYYTGSVWTPLVAGVELGYAEDTAGADGSGGSALADIGGASVSFTLGTARKVNLTGKVVIGSTVSGDVALITLCDSSNTAIVRSGDVGCVSSARSYGAEMSCRVSLAAGSYTYKMRRQRISGTGLIAARGSADQRTFMLAVDLGPA